jgi:pantothenate synthetase
VTDPDTLQPVQHIDGPVLIAGAIWLGSTRLIDNMSWPSPAGFSL